MAEAQQLVLAETPAFFVNGQMIKECLITGLNGWVLSPKQFV